LDKDIPSLFTEDYINTTAWFLACTADALLLLCLLQIGSSLLASLINEGVSQTQAINRTRDTTRTQGTYQTLELINQIPVVALIILAIVSFSLYLQFLTKPQPQLNDSRPISHLYSAYNIIY
jgi:ABC-type proline/glycine betaine transport system permease subunit